MAVIFGATATVEKIVEEIEKLSKDEQESLLSQLRREQYLKNGVPKITRKPADVPMDLIDKWKHDSRKKK